MIDDVKRALDSLLEPGNRDHIEKLAALYASIGDFETALKLEPEPGIGLLFRMRRYEDLIDAAEFLMIEVPEDINVRYLLAFAYQATGQFESAIYVLRSTGMMDALPGSRVRSVADIEAQFTLINALAGFGEGESEELAHSLAEWSYSGAWWGDIYWEALFKSCMLAVLDRDEEALEVLARVTETSRLPWEPLLRDQYCHQRYTNEPVYRGVLDHFDERRRQLRQRLPATLAGFGVQL